ncbi:hypothetical protein ACP2AV_11730 [Aliiroseovarius sp. PTFE2010]|uniref:hypothetical protein n=1 Tax=Aliiroseovarius sp. PTFE2010 TaxID=3417190 RepID=UPI003CFBAA17
MRTFVSFFVLTFLSLALILAGPASRGTALSHTTLTELCIDGVVQAVRMGPDGQPVAPGKDCETSHSCCVLVGDLALPDTLPKRTALLPHPAPALDVTAAFVPRLEFLFAHPRGPPVAQIGQIDQRKIRS